MDAAISRDKSGTLNQEGHLTGLEGISTERTLEIIPTFTLSETGRRVRTVSVNAIDANPWLCLIQAVLSINRSRLMQV